MIKPVSGNLVFLAIFSEWSTGQYLVIKLYVGVKAFDAYVRILNIVLSTAYTFTNACKIKFSLH